MNNCYIYIGQDNGIFKPFGKYYLVSFTDGTQLCIEDEICSLFWIPRKQFEDGFKSIKSIREEKIREILNG